MNVRRYIRLLPAVVLLGTGLLVLKGVDIARAAQASGALADPDQPDNSGLAPTDDGGKPSPDFADVSTISSAAEVDVQSSLGRRRAELDARERGLVMRENLLSAGEARVDQKIAALKALQGQIQALLAQRDARQDAQIASLVKTYSAMKPKDAARIFNSLSDDVLLPVAKGMKPDVLAPVLAGMNPDAAQKLTVKLAALLKLPDTGASAICPTTAADAGALGPLASAIPSETPPVQTAALTPPQVTPLPTPPAPTVTPAVQPPAAAPAASAPPTVKPEPSTAKPAAKKPVAKKAAPPKPAVATASTPVTPPPPKQASTTPAAVTPASVAATPAPTSAKPGTTAAGGPPTVLGPPPGG